MTVSERKIKSLIDDGFEEIGIILQKDGKRVTVDKFGRAQWWTTCGTGEMVSSHAGELMDENNKLYDNNEKLITALRHMVRLYYVADEAYDKDKETHRQLNRMFERFGINL